VDTIADLNPDVKVVPYREALNSSNVRQIFSEYDVIVNGSDNFPTRYLANDACVFLRKPLVDGSIFKFEGQTTVFLPGHGCYRCLYPAPPPPGVVRVAPRPGSWAWSAESSPRSRGSRQSSCSWGLGTRSSEACVFRCVEHGIPAGEIPPGPRLSGVRDHPTITDLIDYHAFCGCRAGSV